MSFGNALRALEGRELYRGGFFVWRRAEGAINIVLVLVGAAIRVKFDQKRFLIGLLNVFEGDRIRSNRERGLKSPDKFFCFLFLGVRIFFGGAFAA